MVMVNMVRLTTDKVMAVVIVSTLKSKLMSGLTGSKSGESQIDLTELIEMLSPKVNKFSHFIGSASAFTSFTSN